MVVSPSFSRTCGEPDEKETFPADADEDDPEMEIDDDIPDEDIIENEPEE